MFRACLASFAVLACVATLCFAQSSVWSGTFTDSHFGGLTHFCINGNNNNLQGSYSEAGILQGNVNTTHAWGMFYQAGTPNEDRDLNCNIGYFIVHADQFGFSGSWKCQGEDYYDDDEGLLWSGVRRSPNEPTDEQCAKLDHSSSDLTIQGEWELDVTSSKVKTMALCNDDDDEFHASYIRPDDDDDNRKEIKGYVEGYELLLNNIVGLGTWYENFKGGAFLAFLRSNGQLGVYQWSGLQGRNGATVIDPYDYSNENDHFADNYFRVSQDGSLCNQFSDLKDLVLDNLPDDDDEEYFFVGDGLFDDDYDEYFYETHLTPINQTLLYILANAPPPPSEEEDAATSLEPASALLMAVVMALAALMY